MNSNRNRNSVPNPKFKVQDGGGDFGEVKVKVEKHLMEMDRQYQVGLGLKMLHSNQPSKQHYAEKRKMDAVSAASVPVGGGEKENDVKLYKSARIDKLKKQALAAAAAAAEQVNENDNNTLNLKRRNSNGNSNETSLEKIKELRVLVGKLETEIYGFYWNDNRSQERYYLKLDGKLSKYYSQLKDIKVPENKVMKPTKEKNNLLKVLTQLQNKLYEQSNVPVHFLGNYYTTSIL